jgi:hypothetical protein
MKFSAIKGLIGAVAPTIGAALGWPCRGRSRKVIHRLLAAKKTKSIEQAVQAASPEDLAKIREAELEFESKDGRTKC